MSIILWTVMGAALAKDSAGSVKVITLDWGADAHEEMPAELVFAPNTTLQVCVDHPAGASVNIAGVGVVGITAGDVLGATAPANVAEGSRDTENPTLKTPIDTQTCKVFAPFQPGVAMVTVTMEQSRSLKLSAEDHVTLTDAAKTLNECDVAQYKTTGLATLSKEVRSTTDTDLGQLVADAKRLVEAGTNGACSAEETKETWQKAATNFVTTLSLVNQSMTTSKRSETFGVIVERQYVGAVRVGVAGTYGAPDNAWEAINQPSDLEAGPVVTQTEGGKVAMEFVVSYTQFIPPIQERDTNLRFGGTFGLGIADLKTAELGLQSVYLGVDIGYKQASITPVFALRHVNTLVGTSEGKPVGTTAEIPLQSAWTPGFGLMVHVPFDLMRSALEGQATAK